MARRRPSGGLAAAAALLLAPPCHGLYDPERRVESARVYGNIHKYGYYFIDLVVGTPRQLVSVIIDTGSSLAAFPCAGCEHCGRHVDPAFDLARSSTAHWVPCGGRCQGGCSRGHCSYTQGYSEGSSIRGYWFEDYVQLGESVQENPAVRSHLGCHHAETNLFYDQKANGIMGIGPQRGTLLRDLFADRGHVRSSVFALCLAEWGGRLSVGGHNASYHKGPMHYIPMDVSRGTYGVPLASISVEGAVVSSELGTTMVDSGTTYTYMASSPYRALRGAIESHCGAGRCGAARHAASGTCWHLPQGTADLERFPRVELAFSGATVRWVPAGYMFRRGTSRTWCYSFQDDGPGAGTTLGASWMMHNEVVFDMEARRLGVAPAVCPEYHRLHSLGNRTAIADKDEESWDAEASAEDLGAARSGGGGWWPYLPLAPLALLVACLSAGCIGRRCVSGRSGSRLRLVRDAELAVWGLIAKEEVQAPDSSTPWL